LLLGGGIEAAAEVKATEEDQPQCLLKRGIEEEGLDLYQNVCQGIEVTGGIKLQQFAGQSSALVHGGCEPFEDVPVVEAMPLYPR